MRLGVCGPGAGSPGTGVMRMPLYCCVGLTVGLSQGVRRRFTTEDAVKHVAARPRTDEARVQPGRTGSHRRKICFYFGVNRKIIKNKGNHFTSVASNLTSRNFVCPNSYFCKKKSHFTCSRNNKTPIVEV
jgi:hypothetical protein